MTILRQRALKSRIDDVIRYYPIDPLRPDNLSMNKKITTYLDKFSLTKACVKLGDEIPQIVGADTQAMGIEIEAEGIVWNSSVTPDSIAPPGWSVVNDPSLRNNGREFVSWPATPAMVRKLLIMLFASFPRVLKSPPEFSWRTSIHAHLNYRMCSVENVISSLILGILFEDSLFSFIGNDRKQSNFCVPVQETEFPDAISKYLNNQYSFNDLLRTWEKYSAINPRPLLFNDHSNSSHPPGNSGGKGTIEYRHLEGTDNLSKIINWLNLLLRLQEASQSFSLDTLEERILNISNRDDYMVLLSEVFGPQKGLLRVRDFKPLLQTSIAAAKECLYPLPNIKELIKQSEKKTTGLKEMVKIRTHFRKPEEEAVKKKQIKQPEGLWAQTLAEQGQQHLSQVLTSWTVPSADVTPLTSDDFEND